MIRLRKSQERGHANHGWLDTRYTFSFADYFDPAFMGFRALRVINEDRVAPGQGFGMHPHRDMEIITHILEGALEHRDSLGTGSVIHRGELQRMTAGTGIRHSEFNPSTTDPVHLVQIWLLPDGKGLTPEYEEKAFPADGRRNQLRLVASRDGRDGSLTVHQDVALYLGELDQTVGHRLEKDRHGWLQVLRGNMRLNGELMTAGDGAAISDERDLSIQPEGAAEVMLFDLA